MSFAASIVIAITALYFLSFAITCFLAPSAVTRFLNGFAGSARAHYAELGIRLSVGASLIVRAPDMLASEAIRALGWILVVTTVALACIPWNWHRRIAERSVPKALQHLKLLGIAASAAGIALLIALFGPRSFN